MDGTKCNPECVRVCRECGAEKPYATGFTRGQRVCKSCRSERYSSRNGYMAPSARRQKVVGFVREESRLAAPLICRTCGFVGPRRNWPKCGPHYRGLCPQCDCSNQDQRPNGRKECRKGSERVCPKCRQPKPIDRYCYCGVCRRDIKRQDREKASRKAFLPKLIAGLEAKTFALDSKIADDCRAAVKKAWRKWTPKLSAAEQYKKRYAADPEAERLRSTRYKHANPGKVAKWNRGRNDRAALYSDGTLTRQAVGELFGAAKRCPYCGVAITGSQKSMDHLDPLNLGGTHGISNVIICCRPCNVRKKDRPFTEWLTMVERTRQSAARSLYARVRGVQPEQVSLTLAWIA